MRALITEIIILVASKPIYIYLVLLVVEGQSICFFSAPLSLWMVQEDAKHLDEKTLNFSYVCNDLDVWLLKNETSGARSNVFTFQQYFGMWKLLLSKIRNKEFT